MHHSILISGIILINAIFPGYAINPEKVYKHKPTVTYREYKVETADRAKINVWEYTPKVPGEVVIIIAGGDAGNMGYMVRQSQDLVEKNFRVITFDYRGFGESSDFPTNRSYLFHKEYCNDLIAVYESTRKNFPAAKIGVYAFSMGTYVTLLAKVKLDFFVAEGFFYNPNLVKRSLKRLKSVEVHLPRTDSLFVVPYPSLIFAGSDDQVTSIGQAKAFSVKNKARVVEFNGPHGAGYSVLSRDRPGDLYIDHITTFVRAVK